MRRLVCNGALERGIRQTVASVVNANVSACWMACFSQADDT
ncbi:hypothetical protein ABIB90_004904 [Bradyrhizobium sp. JR4.1]